MNDLIESASLSYRYRFERDEIESEPEYDPCYLKTLEVIYNITEIFDELEDRQATGRPIPAGIDQEYVDELEAAFQVGQRILDHDRREEIARDMSKCEPDLLRELRATIAYVAPHFSIDLDVPAPDQDVETDGAAA